MILKFEDFVNEEYSRPATPEDFEEFNNTILQTTLKKLMNKNKNMIFIEGYEGKYAMSLGTEDDAFSYFDGYADIYFQIPSKNEVYTFSWAYVKNENNLYNFYMDDESGISLNDDDDNEPDEVTFDMADENFYEACDKTLNKLLN